MAEGFITRKGGVKGTATPTLNFVSKDTESITFTITNNDTATADVFWELGDNTPDANQLSLTTGQTSANQTVSGLTQNTQYTIFAFANAPNKAGSDTVLLTQTTDSFQPITATGGSISDVNISGVDYRIHSFTNTGNNTFTVNSLGSSNDEIDVLVVAGGGSGGSAWNIGRGGGGGGAGGLAFKQGLTVSPQNYTITVGDGGTPLPAESGGGAARGNPGENSETFNITALGGGAGANGTGGVNQTGGNGGSGGGGQTASGGSATQPNTNTNVDDFGNDGGDGGNGTGGGGGGSSQVGADGVSGEETTGADGGDGKDYSNFFTNNYGENGYFAGGGGGGGKGQNTDATGGIGGGGNGGPSDNTIGEFGQDGTGGGGGGSTRQTNNSGFTTPGSEGGSGIVLIRYPLEEVS